MFCDVICDVSHAIFACYLIFPPIDVSSQFGCRTCGLISNVMFIELALIVCVEWRHNRKRMPSSQNNKVMSKWKRLSSNMCECMIRFEETSVVILTGIVANFCALDVRVCCVWVNRSK